MPLRNKIAEILLKEGLKSDAAKEYLHIATSYEDKGDIQKAKDYYQKTLATYPLNRDAVIGLSCLYEKTGELAKATQLIQEATVLFHENVDILIRAAELSLAADDTVHAKSCLSRANEKDAENIKARSLLGELYLKEGLQEKAWQEFSVVLDKLTLEEQYDNAINLLNNFREIEPIETGKRLISLYKQIGEEARTVEALTALGDVYYTKGIYDESLACYNEGLEIMPDNEYLRERTAGISKELGEGIPDFSETVEPDFASPAEEKESEFRAPEFPVSDEEEVSEPFEEEVPEPFTPKPPAPGEEVSGHISIKAEKTIDEIFTEADIFARYGLLNEAQKLLEKLKLRDPENIDLHVRLKTIYVDIDDKEAAVTECLILSELYKRNHEVESSDKILREAFEIHPSDPRLAEKGFADFLETTAITAHPGEAFTGEAAGEKAPGEDYSEELSEAEFYARQGLTQEAQAILLKLRELYPEDKEITERLESLGGGAAILDTTALSETAETLETEFELPAEGAPSEFLLTDKTPWEEEVSGEEIEKPGYEDFTIGEQEISEAQEMPEPVFDNDVLEIFQEFKKGLENELEDEDSETHYNLGIAYKEMGLVDDAIKEFQIAKNDKKRFLQSSTMLGFCYMEKGLYSLAIDILKKILASSKDQDESYWAVKYELAEAYEKNGDLKESVDLYTEVYGWNANFRNVAERVSTLKASVPVNYTKEKTKKKKDRVSYL